MATEKQIKYWKSMVGRKLSDEHKEKIRQSSLISINSGRFAKGHKTWNKDLKIQTNTGRTHIKKGQHLSPDTQFKKGYKHTKEWKDLMSKKRSGENHYNWKGDNVGYSSLHKWVKKQLGNPECCENCKNSNLKHRQYHWANISRNYKRVTTDWRRLCAKCHKTYDRVN